MKHIATDSKRSLFDLLARTRSLQAAKMTLEPGATSDDSVSNEHLASEQWLFVISGAGEAIVGKRRTALRTIKLREGSLLLIERRELHQIKNTGRRPLQTINFYAPPAYDTHGDAL
jgi:oxalate decarboxylase/phosphoglucose isomerase-like protein (cupin superfamily)